MLNRWRFVCDVCGRLWPDPVGARSCCPRKGGGVV